MSRQDPEILVAIGGTNTPAGVAALHGIPGIGSVTLVSDGDIAPSFARLDPDLVVFSLSEPDNGIGALYRILDPCLDRTRVLASVGERNEKLVGVLGRLGIECCVPSALGARVVARLSLPSVVHRTSSEQRSAPYTQESTLDLIADTVRASRTPLSATAVSARCGLSVVTCRRYLKRLAAKGKVTVATRYQTVGRPTSLYRWSPTPSRPAPGTAPGSARSSAMGTGQPGRTGMPRTRFTPR
ncbi:hypothetical protein [Streptomyces sp. NPDC005244]|uniref:hypothetical protein n=1 Tax=Streptomyces sp. NPDC005244 TaxID=3364708 RepID=UPI0036777578